MRAREIFEQCRDACERIEELTFAIDNGGGQRKGEPTHGGGISDPTASRAIYLAEKMPELIAERDELIAFVGECMRIIDGIRIAFTGAYAACVEMRYIDGMRICDIAEEMGVSKGTVHRRISVAFDYVDTVGVRRASLGLGVAE
jgi:predicted DNA-binding protein (UPF0251 family)